MTTYVCKHGGEKQLFHTEQPAHTREIPSDLELASGLLCVPRLLPINIIIIIITP